MTEKEMVEAARLIAKLAHEGQMDKAGNAYFTHPEAVAAMLDDPEAKAVGYLHDTVEDHEDGVPYMEYVEEIGKDPLAREVKLADLAHNMDLSRIPDPAQRDFDRIEKKYKPAYKYLKSLE